MSIRVEACVAQHIGDRLEQQDRAAIFQHPKRPDVLMAVVADGMGGHTGGAIAAEQVLHKAQQTFETFSPGHESPPEMLQAIVNEAHLVIKLARFTSEQDPHSTAAVLLFQPGRVDWAFCGDSRIYHFRGAELVTKSEDHSLVGQMLRQGRLTEKQARVHPQRNLLLTCLGDEREPRVDAGIAKPVGADDSFVICSDGLWGYFSDAELGRAVAAHPPRLAAEELIHGARERAAGAGDNISVIIVKLVEQESRGAKPNGVVPRVAAAAIAPVFESARR